MHMQNLLRSLLKGSASVDQHHDDTAATLIQTESFEPNDLPTGLARYGPPCYSGTGREKEDACFVLSQAGVPVLSECVTSERV
jgi:hypothetical protein